MVLRIQYKNDKFDYVNDFALGRLITTNEIKRFYRPSEERWITIGTDTIRGMGGYYEGPERRQGSLSSIMQHKKNANHLQPPL